MGALASGSGQFQKTRLMLQKYLKKRMRHNMYLTPEEEKIFNGERGATYQKAIRILAALGDIYDADRLIPIRSAQIAGVSYKTIGDEGFEWISDLKGTVAVPSILNPAGMDRECWKEMGISQDFADKQERIIQAYRALGGEIECTCTPYYIFDNLAGFGDHVAWSESSAISYANSVIGARTNREGGPSALSAALVGKTANYGYHLDENREPNILIQINEIYKSSCLNMGSGEPDLIAFGCPHCSVDELDRLAQLLDGKRVKKEVWICTSRSIKNRNPELIRRIKRSGAK